MKFSNTIELEISGERALFRDPTSSESLPVPSYESLKGILGSIYWNPVFTWVPDNLRVMEHISWHGEGMRISTFSESTNSKRVQNASVQYLRSVKYQLRAHFIWNEQRPDLEHDRDENKHFRIALRSLSRGGRRAIYLGSADCPGTVRSIHFGSGAGDYDNTGSTDLGSLFHSFDHAAGIPLYSDLSMDNGLIDLSPVNTRQKGRPSCRSF